MEKNSMENLYPGLALILAIDRNNTRNKNNTKNSEQMVNLFK